MSLLLITGLSGSGKSRAVDALEDIGFFCIDNIPPKLIPTFVELIQHSDNKISKVAIVTDVRGGVMFDDFIQEIDRLLVLNIKFKLLFLDCDDDELFRRYKETRRKHPLAEENNASLQQSIENEREILASAKNRADYIIDTSHYTNMQLRERIRDIFLDGNSSSMLINFMSFGFKYGSPKEADLVFDVRCLPNPFYVDELREITGLDKKVSSYVFSFPQSMTLLSKLSDLIDFLLPLYINEGKSQLTIAVGCTGGKHRSVSFAEYFSEHLSKNNIRNIVTHRDIIKI